MPADGDTTFSQHRLGGRINAAPIDCPLGRVGPSIGAAQMLDRASSADGVRRLCSGGIDGLSLVTDDSGDKLLSVHLGRITSEQPRAGSVSRARAHFDAHPDAHCHTSADLYADELAGGLYARLLGQQRQRRWRLALGHGQRSQLGCRWRLRDQPVQPGHALQRVLQEPDRSVHREQRDDGRDHHAGRDGRSP
jgi:hypothetical protein